MMFYKILTFSTILQTDHRTLGTFMNVTLTLTKVNIFHVTVWNDSNSQKFKVLSFTLTVDAFCPILDMADVIYFDCTAKMKKYETSNVYHYNFSESTKASSLVPHFAYPYLPRGILFFFVSSPTLEKRKFPTICFNWLSLATTDFKKNMWNIL